MAKLEFDLQEAVDNIYALMLLFTRRASSSKLDITTENIQLQLDNTTTNIQLQLDNSP
jgi:hypothetical protein